MTYATESLTSSQSIKANCNGKAENGDFSRNERKTKRDNIRNTTRRSNLGVKPACDRGNHKICYAGTAKSRECIGTECPKPSMKRERNEKELEKGTEPHEKIGFNKLSIEKEWI